MVPDYLTIAIPVYIPIWSPSSIFFGPGFIASVPMHRWIEIDAAAKIFIFQAQSEVWSGYNLGLVVGPRGGFVLRPEVGWLRAGSENVAIEFGIGIGFPTVPGTPARSRGAGRGTPP
jgi:hypothetical protein